MKDEKETAFSLAIEAAQEIANRQSPEILGGVFRYPLNAALKCDPTIFAAEGIVKDIPIIHVEFRFIRGEWVFDGVKGF